MSNDRIIIIGAGMAGAATAYFLTRKGVRNIRLLEREKLAGTQSTGRNAAILRTMIPDPLLNQIACKSAEFYYNPPAGFSSEALVDKVGVYLAASAEHAQTLLTWCDNNPGNRQERVAASQMYNQVPILAPGLQTVTFKQDDGILDVHAILQGFIRGACHSGAELRLGSEFQGLRIKDGSIIGIETSEGFMEASKVVVANGGWASVSRTFNGYELPFAPYRRHLLVTEPLPQVNARWPVVWILFPSRKRRIAHEWVRRRKSTSRTRGSDRPHRTGANCQQGIPLAPFSCGCPRCPGLGRDANLCAGRPFCNRLRSTTTGALLGGRTGRPWNHLRSRNRHIGCRLDRGWA
jgi:glycine/D-amino acid oxidase-like deaminating enzyme